MTTVRPADSHLAELWPDLWPLIRAYNQQRSPVRVDDLPSDPGVGERWLVNDADATTFWSEVSDGGSNLVPVTWDGSKWRIG